MPSEYRATLKGVTDSRYSGKVSHFRGIQYALIPHRFAKPILNNEWLSQKSDFTKFGPRCPQPPVDLHKFMHIPRNLPTHDAEDEDELRCTNLNVTCPSDIGLNNLPTLLWIYGGSQVNTFGSATQKMADPGPIIAQSVELGQPIILVTVNYRLNYFGFGDGNGEFNLGLQDLKSSLDWVRNYIRDFGGNPDNITLGGISAGAVYTHALLASGSTGGVERAILMSGSLYATPPQPEKRCLGIVGVAEGNLALIEMEKGNMNPGEAVESTLAGAPVTRVIQTLKDLQITSMWMWPESTLKDWKNSPKVFGPLKGVLISDCEFEASDDEESMLKLSASKIVDAFNIPSASAAQQIAKAYGISNDDENRCQRAAIDFLNDCYYAFPTHLIADDINTAGGNAYQVYFDRPNPFDATARAHHGVDLFAVFGGYDGFIDDDMRTTGRLLRDKWIRFVNGASPWSRDLIYACGPTKEPVMLTRADAAERRRVKQFAVLKDAGLDVYQEIRLKLAAAAHAA